MGAWYVFASIGLYPMIPGVAGLSINIPSFEEVLISLPNNKTLKIITPKTNNFYTKSLLLNNNSHYSSWIKWDKIKNGGVLEFETTTNKQSNWGETEPPPSFN